MTGHPSVNPDDVWTVLVEECGASEGGREAWLFSVAHHGWPIEYRFIGSLGFGGKVRYGRDANHYVSCYPEDKTPERTDAIDRANLRLTHLTEAISG